MNQLPALVVSRKRVNIFHQIKARLLKNEEPFLDMLSKSLKGNKACEGLLGHPCIGELCHKFIEFKNIDPVTKKELIFHKCSDLQSMFLLEVIRDDQKLTNNLLTQILEELKKGR